MSKATDRETEILAKFYERLGRFINSSAVTLWRAEMKTYYRAMASDQWSLDDFKERERRSKPSTVFNNTSCLVRAISGYEIVNRSKIGYYPRVPSMDANKEVDATSDVVEGIQDKSGFFSESSQATEDVLICGLGATVSTFNYFNADATYGEVEERRIFSGFLLYDNQVRGRRLNRSAKWAGYVQPVASDWLDEEFKDKQGYAYDYSSIGGIGDSELLNFWDAYTAIDNIDLIYHYEWIEPEKIYRCMNPFNAELINDQTPLGDTGKTTGQFIAEFAGGMEDALGVDLLQGTFSLDRKQYKEYRESLGILTELTGIPFESQGQVGERNKYYQARIARGCILDWQESWCQTAFTITYKTGYYDESRNCFYGVLRDMLPVQQALNTAVSDYISYLESVPKGGQEIEIDAVPDIKKYIESRVNEQDVTVYLPGGLGKSRPKQVPGAISGLSEFIFFCREQLAGVVGLTADFLGSVESGNMTSALYGKMMRQTRMVLAPIFDSNTEYLMDKGSVYLEAAKVLIENSNGMILRRMSGNKTEEEFERIEAQALSNSYDIVVTDRPMTDDERQDRFNSLLELQAKIPNVNIMPLAIEDAPIDEEKKAQILQMMQPAPPPPPDPLNTALLESQVRMQEAQAMQTQAQAKKTMAEAAEIEKQVDLADDKSRAEIAQKLSAAELNAAKVEQIAAESKAQIAEAMGAIMQRIDGMKASAPEPVRVTNVDSQAFAPLAESNRAIMEALAGLANDLTMNQQQATAAIMQAMMAEREAVMDDEGRVIGMRLKAM
jgi:hypothetical protein